MKAGRKTLACVVTIVALGVDAKAIPADTQGHPYEAIAERNVFNLKSPVVETTEPTNAPPFSVKLTGIWTVLGGDNKRVSLLVSEPASPGKQAGKEQPVILGEGQREGPIEVLAVDEKAGAVKINNGGTTMIVSFETHGVKPPTGSMPAPIGGAPGTIPPPTGANPSLGAVPPPGSYNGGRTPTVTPAANTLNAANNASAAALSRIPQRPSRMSQENNTAVPNAPEVPPEVNAILTEAERLRTQHEVDAGRLPPLPPTALTPK